MSAISQALLNHYLDIGHPIARAAQLAKEELRHREEIAKKNRADSRSDSLARKARS